jgi:hypothetical protein
VRTEPRQLRELIQTELRQPTYTPRTLLPSLSHAWIARYPIATHSLTLSHFKRLDIGKANVRLAQCICLVIGDGQMDHLDGDGRITVLDADLFILPSNVWSWHTLR